MKRDKVSTLLAWVCFCFVHIIVASGQAYTVSQYAQYRSTTVSGRLAMDDLGNLYVAHYDDGKIMSIDSSRQSTVFAEGLGNLYDITWGGGSAYDNYLYVSSRSPNFSNDKILRVDLTGNAVAFASMTFPAHGVTFVGIDRTGNYGGSMFSSGSSQDRLYSISILGQRTLFADWPGHTDGGGPYGIGFDLSGKYENKMYVATSFQPQDADLSGLFKINLDGTAERFATDLVSALIVDFDRVGAYFDNDMFVMGRTGFNASHSLWRVFGDGSSQEFMQGVSSFTFGDDGAMYVSRYDGGTETVFISRVIPEPSVLALLAAGSLFLRKRRI